MIYYCVLYDGWFHSKVDEKYILVSKNVIPLCNRRFHSQVDEKCILFCETELLYNRRLDKIVILVENQGAPRFLSMYAFRFLDISSLSYMFLQTIYNRTYIKISNQTMLLSHTFKFPGRPSLSGPVHPLIIPFTFAIQNCVKCITPGKATRLDLRIAQLRYLGRGHHRHRPRPLEEQAHRRTIVRLRTRVFVSPSLDRFLYEQPSCYRTISCRCHDPHNFVVWKCIPYLWSYRDC